MAKKKVVRYTEEEFITLLENIVKRVKKEELNETRGYSVKRIMNDPKSAKKYSHNTKWCFNRYPEWIENYGPITVYITPNDEKIVELNGRYWDSQDTEISKEEAENILGCRVGEVNESRRKVSNRRPRK